MVEAIRQEGAAGVGYGQNLADVGRDRLPDYLYNKGGFEVHPTDRPGIYYATGVHLGFFGTWDYCIAAMINEPDLFYGPVPAALTLAGSHSLSIPPGPHPDTVIAAQRASLQVALGRLGIPAPSEGVVTNLYLAEPIAIPAPPTQAAPDPPSNSAASTSSPAFDGGGALLLALGLLLAAAIGVAVAARR